MIYQSAEQTFLSRGTSNIYVLIGCTQFSLPRRTNCKWRIGEQSQFQNPSNMVLSIFSSDISTLWDLHVFQTFFWKDQMINGSSSALSLSCGVMQSVKPGSSCTWQNLAQVMFVIAEALSQKIRVSFSLASMCTNLAFNAGFLQGMPLFLLKLNSSWQWGFQQMCYSSVKDQPLLRGFFWFVESNLPHFVLLQRRTLLMDYSLSKSFSLWPRISGERIKQEEAPLPDSLNPVSIFCNWTWEINCWEDMSITMKILFTSQKLCTSWESTYIWSLKKKKNPNFLNALLSIELSLLSKNPITLFYSFTPIFIGGTYSTWAKELSAVPQNFLQKKDSFPNASYSET